MKIPREAAEITLSGPPHNAWAVVDVEANERVVPITVELPSGAQLYKAHVRQFGAGSEIRLRLPRETPPGTYSGAATLGGQMRRVAVRIEALHNLRVQPMQSTVTVGNGDKAEFSIEIVNRGNTPFDVPANVAFDLDDARGQGRALGRTLRAPLGPNESRVDRFFEEMRSEHGGEARVSVVQGSGPLAPAEARTLSCVLVVPQSLQTGRSYKGAWLIGNTNHVVIVEVAKALATRGGTPR